MADMHQRVRTRDLDDSAFAVSPAGLNWGQRIAAFKRALQRIIASEASLRCAGVAFFGFMSLFPAIAAAMMLFGLFLDGGIINQIMAQMAPLMPESVESILNERLETLNSQDAPVLGIGLVLTLGFALWSGSRGVNALTYALTRAYREEDERSFIRGALMSLGLTLGAFVMMGIILVALAVLPAAFAILPLGRFTEQIVLLLRWPVIAVLVFAAVMLLFRVAPHRRAAKWRWLLPGALLASLLWLAGSYLFSFYVENFGSYDATFGALAAVVVLLLWFYYSAMIFVLGAMVNAELELETVKDSTRGPSRPVGERDAYVADHLAEKEQ